MTETGSKLSFKKRASFWWSQDQNQIAVCFGIIAIILALVFTRDYGNASYEQCSMESRIRKVDYRDGSSLSCYQVYDRRSGGWKIVICGRSISCIIPNEPCKDKTCGVSMPVY